MKIKESFSNLRQKMAKAKTEKAKAKLLQDKTHEFREFIRFAELALQHDHPYDSLRDGVMRFMEKMVKPGIFPLATPLNGEFTYTHHYNDTWQAHGVTMRFKKLINHELKDASLLHVAAMMGVPEMIEGLLKLGADPNRKDGAGKKPGDYLFYNPSYIREYDYLKVKAKLPAAEAPRMRIPTI